MRLPQIMRIPSEDKECEWARQRSECSAGLRYPVVVESMVNTGRLDWAGVADYMSIRPAAISRVRGPGGHSKCANLRAMTLHVDPHASWTVRPNELYEPRSQYAAYRRRPAWSRGSPSLMANRP